MTGEAICKEISDSGLRGRGGGGLPRGPQVGERPAPAAGKKYVVCNGDEGDPGAFMDAPSWRATPLHH